MKESKHLGPNNSKNLVPYTREFVIIVMIVITEFDCILQIRTFNVLIIDVFDHCNGLSNLLI
jgi:hypothetical protein